MRLLLPLLLFAASEAAIPIDSGVSYWHGNIQGSNAGTAGYTFYANVFDLFQEGYPINAQMGLAGTWYTLPRDQGQAVNTCACPKWGQEIQCCNQEQSWCTQMAWSIEGGGGYWCVPQKRHPSPSYTQSRRFPSSFLLSSHAPSHRDRM